MMSAQPTELNPQVGQGSTPGSPPATCSAGSRRPSAPGWGTLTLMEEATDGAGNQAPPQKIATGKEEATARVADQAPPPVKATGEEEKATAGVIDQAPPPGKATGKKGTDGASNRNATGRKGSVGNDITTKKDTSEGETPATPGENEDMETDDINSEAASEKEKEIAKLGLLSEAQAFGRSPRVGRSPVKGATVCGSIQAPKPTTVNIAPLFRGAGGLGGKTPPPRSRSSSASHKRKKMGGPSSPRMEKTGSLFGDMKNGIFELRELVKANVNTKNEIKYLVEELYQTMVAAEEEAEDEAEEPVTPSTAATSDAPLWPASTICQRCQRNVHIDTDTSATQTLPSEEVREMSDAIDVRNLIDAGAENLEDLIKRPWPQRTYTSTRMAGGSILTDTESEARVLLVNVEKEDGRLSNLSGQLPVLKEHLKKHKLQDGQVLEIEQCDTLPVEDAADIQPAKKRLVIIAGIQVPCTAGKLAEQLAGIKDRIEKRNGLPNVAIGLPEGVEPVVLRKVAEITLAQSSIKARIYTGKNKPVDSRPRVKLKPQTGTATVLISGKSGKSYADTLKAIKGAVKPEECGVTVQKAMETNKGCIRLVIKEQRAGARNEFVKKVKEVNAADDVSLKTRKSTVIIQDLDETVTQEEVAAAISAAVNDLEQTEVGQIRKGPGGTCSVSVQLPQRKASELCKLKRVKIGWLRCRVKEKIYLTRCYNCHSLEHLGKDCKENKNTARQCYKCCKEGHLAKDCKNDPHCLSCNTEGHRADSMACPTYRAKVEALRKSRQKGAGNLAKPNGESHTS